MYNGENKSIVFPAGYNSKFDLVETKIELDLTIFENVISRFKLII